MKLIDFDEKFNKKMAQMLEKHAGERTEEEWENAIAEAYATFGDTFMGAIGKTPRQYFAEMSDACLVEVLKEYLLQDISVPDFLCEEITARGEFAELVALLSETDEQLIMYAINLLGAAKKAFPRYCEMLSQEDYDEHIKDAIADILKEHADEVVGKVLPLTEGENRAYALEILSKCRKRDERVYAALRGAFCSGEDKDLPLYAGYLASYGDERILPDLYRTIEREDIDYVLFQELKFAIEALGGEYEKERDFSQDKAYQKIMQAGGGTDIFGAKKNKNTK